MTVTQMACNAGDRVSIPGSGRSCGEGNGYPLQCSCLDRGFCGQRSLVGCSPWDHKESDTTEWLTLSLFINVGDAYFGYKNVDFMHWIKCKLWSRSLFLKWKWFQDFQKPGGISTLGMFHPVKAPKCLDVSPIILDTDVQVVNFITRSSSRASTKTHHQCSSTCVF